MTDREKVIKSIDDRIKNFVPCCTSDVLDLELLKSAIELLKEQPDVVRCKDCTHWDKGCTEDCENSDSVCFHNGWCQPEWYCADGEKKT